MLLRIANNEDLTNLVKLNMDVHQVHVKLEPSVFCELNEENLYNSILQSLEDKNTTIVVAEDGRSLIGYMLLQKRIRPKNEIMHKRKCVYIDQVYVLESYRNQGVFKLMLTKAKELALNWGFNKLELDVWSNNIEAKKSFLQSGFIAYNEKMKIEL